MSKMVDRVAFAIQGASFDSLTRGEAQSYARAAIEAMREPTEAILHAALPPADGDWLELERPHLPRLWQRMIDAALKD